MSRHFGAETKTIDTIDYVTGIGNAILPLRTLLITPAGQEESSFFCQLPERCCKDGKGRPGSCCCRCACFWASLQCSEHSSFPPVEQIHYHQPPTEPWPQLNHNSAPPLLYVGLKLCSSCLLTELGNRCCTVDGRLLWMHVLVETLVAM